MNKKQKPDIFPLADKLRPEKFSDFTGQFHLTGEGKIVWSFIKNKKLGSLIFWGPPGTGKTTLSRILVSELDFPSTEFSATVSKIGEIREAMKMSADLKKINGKPLVLFVDEIHHFNRHIQDAFLPYVERGDIILLGTTTENPAYKMNRALLSRLKILEFQPLSDKDLRDILAKGMDKIKENLGISLGLKKDIENILINFSSGDARKLLNILELLANVVKEGEKIDKKVVEDIIQKRISHYDRTGDERYTLISAFHKAVRNSDVDASLFWLYRMMEGGEDPLFIIRRMIRISVEDIGFADREALELCLNMKDAYEYLGSPEGDLFLTQATIYLASAPKSNSLYVADKEMKKLVEKYKEAKVPLNIINPSNFLNRRKGAGKGYVYAHDVPEKTTTLETMPEEVSERGLYKPNILGFEKKIKERIEYWEKLKKDLKKRGKGGS
ncbi:MAG: replication-associated recombination protein A [Acidobacteriota bacterium]